MTTNGSPKTKPTVVLVHGAFAESSSWNGVIDRLIEEGYPVLAAAVPLRGVKSDSEYLASILEGIEGKLVLVGHSYGGLLIGHAAAGNPPPTALAFVRAYALAARESAAGRPGPCEGRT